MSGWQNSSRRDELPPDWARRRSYVLKRDKGLCVWRMTNGRECSQPATDVDHIEPGSDHSPANLRSLCEWHHDKKSGAEGGRASWAKRKTISERFVRSEKHPGLM